MNLCKACLQLRKWGASAFPKFRFPRPLHSCAVGHLPHSPPITSYFVSFQGCYLTLLICVELIVRLFHAIASIETSALILEESNVFFTEEGRWWWRERSINQPEIRLMAELATGSPQSRYRVQARISHLLLHLSIAGDQPPEPPCSPSNPEDRHLTRK